MIVRSPLQVPDYAWEVVTGLKSRPKRLPCKLFYDERGSALFDEITHRPEYYLTRTEQEILGTNAREIIQQAGVPLSLVELGAGTAIKTMTLLHAIARRQLRIEYAPVDISASALAAATARVRLEFPQAAVESVVTDFENGFAFLRNIEQRKLVLYLGSSIGNFEYNEAVSLLTRVRENLSPGDALLLGADMVKGADILIPAYDDAAGVTAEFNKNILRRINRELAGDFDLESFRHVAEWNAAAARIEIYLESRHSQAINLRVANLRVRFAARERIHTENSHKYSIDSVTGMLCASGYRLEKSWFDERQWFGLHLARV